MTLLPRPTDFAAIAATNAQADINYLLRIFLGQIRDTFAGLDRCDRHDAITYRKRGDSAGFERVTHALSRSRCSGRRRAADASDAGCQAERRPMPGQRRPILPPLFSARDGGEDGGTGGQADTDQAPGAIEEVTDRPSAAGQRVSTRSIAIAASAMTPAAKAIVQIGSVGNHAFMIEPITVATSSCGTTTKTLNNPM